jgi:hypothetical protein
MRKALTFVTILLLAGCSGGESQADRNGNMAEASDSLASDASSPTPPGITPTAAPGVAFSYSYAFRLPAPRISAVQEQHAAACEKLGPSRCRITGMHYEQNEGGDDIRAELAFKLDPTLARGFGRDGVEAVRRAEGELARAEISGTDVGAEIAAGNQATAELGDELSRIERQLAKPGLSASERTQLQQHAQELRQSTRTTQAQQTERRAQLAQTPMVFAYAAGETGGRIAQAARNAAETFEGSLAALIVVALTLLPWAVLALLLWLLWRWVNRRFLGLGPVRDSANPITVPAA